MDFAERYGPWALIAGASEGTGSAYARLLAERGLSLILVARRQAPLDALAAELGARFGTECVTASIDLGQPDAAARMIEAAADRAVGLYVGNAGADPHGSALLDRPAADWRQLLTRNVLTTMEGVHHFAAAMRDRGRGGVLLSNSYACYGGGRSMACYSGSKAFELAFAESLWSELSPYGVHVLTLVMGTTDTPAFNALLSSRGLSLPPGTATADAVAAFGLASLADGPVQNWGVPPETGLGDGVGSAAQRRTRIGVIDQASRAVFGG